MGIEIILYDSSPVVQKIFLHVLYHYKPTVHRIDNTSKLVEKIQYSRPDMIFIDSSLSQNIKNQINDAKLNNIPVILMAKTDLKPEELKSSSAIDILKKPISADRLRNLVTRFVPEAKRNILNKHLKFPPIPDFIDSETNQDEKKINIQQKDPYTVHTKQSASTTIKPISQFTSGDENEQNSSPVKAPIFSQAQDQTPPHQHTIQQNQQKPAPPPLGESEEEGIKPITGTSFTEFKPGQNSSPIKAPIFDQTSAKPSLSPVSPISPVTDDESSESEGIKPVTGTNITKLEERFKETDIDKKLADQKIYQPQHNTTQNLSEVKELNKEQDSVQVLKKPSDPKEPYSSQREEPAFKQESAPVKVLPNMDVTQLKNQLITDIKQWEKEEIKKAVRAELKTLFEQNSQKIIQEIAEKAIWQVVPELSKKLITKELNRLLNTEENSPEEPLPLSGQEEDENQENNLTKQELDLDYSQSLGEFSKLDDLDEEMNEHSNNNEEK